MYDFRRAEYFCEEGGRECSGYDPCRDCERNGGTFGGWNECGLDDIDLGGMDRLLCMVFN